MKGNAITRLCLVLILFGTVIARAQDTDTQISKALSEEIDEEGPILLKFEPDILVNMAEQRAEIDRNRAMLDTMDLSVHKRQRLIRDLYRNRPSKRLSKVLLAKTGVEESKH